MGRVTTLDARRTALVLIDLMDRIIANQLAPRPGSEVLTASLGLARTFREAGALVVAVRVERPNVAEQPPGSDLAAEVAAVADEVLVKRTIGAFQGTGLHELLAAREVDTLVFAGIATNLGVESTARAAADHGYETVFVEDAMAALSEAEHRASVELDFPRLGEVVSAGDLRLG